MRFIRQRKEDPMVKDDYYVIVFRVLKYLYKQLKMGKLPDPDMLRSDSETFHVNALYWRFILISMQEDGFIRGLKKGEGEPGYDQLEDQLQNLQITTKGIDYLMKNTERVDKALKGIVKIV